MPPQANRANHQGLVPTPPPALRAHLVTKGQWLRAIHRMAPGGIQMSLIPTRRRRENFLSEPRGTEKKGTERAVDVCTAKEKKFFTMEQYLCIRRRKKNLFP